MQRRSLRRRGGPAIAFAAAASMIVTSLAALPAAAQPAPAATAQQVDVNEADSSINGYRNVGYFTQWGVYGRDFKLHKVHESGAAENLTHLNYAFGNIHHETLTCFIANKAQGTGPNGSDGAGDAWADFGMGYTAANSVSGVADTWDQPLAGNFNQIRQLKEEHPHVRALISLGGWTWSKNFSRAAATQQSRETLVESCIDLYIRGNLPVIDGRGGPGAAAGVFDGIDIDWEWPGSHNGLEGNHVDPVNDRRNFNLLLEEFRTQLDELGRETGRDYLLTAFLPANPADIEAGGWNDPEIFEYLDFGNVQGYDLHGAWDAGLTGHQGNLWADPADPREASRQFSVHEAVEMYTSAGIDRSQLGVGLAMYGRGWQGASSADAWGPATGAAPGTWEAGNEDYDKLRTRGQDHFDPAVGAAWRYDGNQWWSYDNARSVAAKADYIADQALGGGMWWDLSGNHDGELLDALMTPLRAATEGPVTNPDAEPTDPEPTDPEPTDPEPTDPEPTDPEPTDPEPTEPEPTEPEPTEPEPTEPVDTCETPWSSTTTYWGGDLASYDGTNYRAQWWSLGDVPGTQQWGPWQAIEACGVVEPTDPEPTDPEPTDPEPTDPEPTDPAEPGEHEQCRPDGMYRTPGVEVPYCDVYDSNGREILPNDLDRRIIGYFTSWRTGQGDQPRYLASDIPWDRLSHINYAFAHVGADNRVSVNADVPGNATTDMTWPGVPGAEMDPALDYTGHFNLLSRYQDLNPGVKILPAVGGWAESGGYLTADGDRVATGGFYTMTQSQAAIDTFADSVVDLIRTYGFDGIDIDYEYPTSNNQAGNPEDFWIADANRGNLWEGYEALLRTLREELDRAGAEDGEYYLLTIAAPSSGWLLRGMEMHQITQYVDYVNMMTYDLHGAWNEYVGGNSPLFDNGADPELAAGGIYGAYDGIGYLNGDWAAHYFRGAMQAGRINLGVGFYTRGWEGVTGGTFGDGGRAPAPAGYTCPAGTSGRCGAGATGIDNLWHDSDPMGSPVPAGVNPIWHALNLQHGVVGDYVASYGVPTTITGSYSHHTDPVAKNEWWWNATTRTYLTGDTAHTIGEKAEYVADQGLGGVMIWELAGDYGYDQARGQYGIGSTMVDTLHDTLSSTTPYGATKAEGAMPTQAIDLSIDYTEFALGDNNYPISPKVVFRNHSASAIPAGSTISFQYGTSTAAGMSDWSGLGTTTTHVGHTGPNVGGLDGNFHTARFTVPAGGIPAGGSLTNQLKWALPIAQFSNVIVTIDGTPYATTYDHPRGVTVVEPGTGEPGGPGEPTDPEPTDPEPTDPGDCSVAAWAAGTVYTGGDRASHGGLLWEARHWTQGNTPAPSDWGPWKLIGAC